LLVGGRWHCYVVVNNCLLQSSTIVYYRVADLKSGAPLGQRMTSREKKGEGGGQGQEGRGGKVGPGADQGGHHQEAEVARREDGGQEAAAQATATVMGMGNAAPPPSRDLATTITTLTVNDHVAGDAAVGAVGIVNDGDDIGGGRGPGGFDKEEALVLAAEAAAVLIADDADGGNSGVAIVGGAFKEAVARAGAAGASGVEMTTMGGSGGGGNYADPAGAILDEDGRHPLGLPWRIRHCNCS
jgi:hypothetical protein